jgi:hypothetical protein
MYCGSLVYDFMHLDQAYLDYLGRLLKSEHSHICHTCIGSYVDLVNGYVHDIHIIVDTSSGKGEALYVFGGYVR